VHLALVPVLMAIGMASECTRAVARRTIELCEESGAMERALPALFAEASYYSSSGEIKTALELSSRVVGIGVDNNDLATLRAGHRFAGSCLLWIGDLEAAERHLHTAISFAGRVAPGAQRADTDFDHHAAALVLTGHLKLRLAAFADGWPLHDEAERVANEAGHAFTIAFVLLHRLLSEAMTSNLVSLQRTIRTFTELCEKREIVQWRHIDQSAGQPGGAGLRQSGSAPRLKVAARNIATYTRPGDDSDRPAQRDRDRQRARPDRDRQLVPEARPEGV
jgi:hypothetical protein